MDAFAMVWLALQWAVLTAQMANDPQLACHVIDFGIGQMERAKKEKKKKTRRA